MARRTVLMAVVVVLTAVLFVHHATQGAMQARALTAEKTEEWAGRGLQELSRKHLLGGSEDDVAAPPGAVLSRPRRWQSDDTPAARPNDDTAATRPLVSGHRADSARPHLLLQVFRH